MNGDEIQSLVHLGIFDRNKPADREIMLSLLDKPKETPMTWDGIPEHRNLSGDGDEPPKTAGEYRRQIADWLARRPKAAPLSVAEFIRGQQAELAGRNPPEPVPAMPADPFNEIAEAAVAQVAMIEAVREAGLPEPSALFYVACLVQVGLAIQQGGLGQPPREPGQM